MTTAAIHHPKIIFTLLKSFDADLKHTTMSLPLDWHLLDAYTYKETDPKPSSLATIPNNTIPNNTIPNIIIKKSFQGSLFQCILFSIQGKSCRDIREELQEKQNIIKALSSGELDKKKLKTMPYRLTHVELEEIISDLLTLSTRRQEYASCFGMISVNILETILYCHYYKKNMVLVHPLQKTWVEFRYPDAETAEWDIVLKVVQGNQGGTLFEVVDTTAFPAFSSFIKAENGLTLLKTISNYKLADLKSLYSTLIGPVSENMKKQALYDAIRDIQK